MTGHFENRTHLQLSHPQRRVWFTEILYPGTGVGNLAGCVHFAGRLEHLKLLEAAINCVIASNDALRIRLRATTPLGCAQYLSESAPAKMEVMTIGEDRKELLEAAKVPFRLLDGPLYRFILLRMPGERIGFFFNYHHIVVDALTVSLLNKRIFAAFKSMAEGQTTEAHEANPSFITFLEREKKYLASSAFVADQTFWESQFDGYENTASESRQMTAIGTRRYEHTFSPELTGEISRFCAQHDTTVFRFFMAVFFVYFSRTTGCEDMVISTGHHNRIGNDDMRMAGMTVSTVPIRKLVDEQQSFRSFLRATHEQISSCLARQQYPFDLLAQMLREKGQDPQRLIHYFINHIPSFDGDYAVERYSPGADLACLNIKINPNQHPKNDPLQLCIDSRVSMFDGASTVRIFEEVEHLLAHAIENPDLSLRELGQEGRPHSTEGHCGASILRGENRPVSNFLDMFAATVKKYPARNAVWAPEGSRTYSSLDKETTRLAAALKTRGVGEGDYVGIMMDRCADFVVAAISIFKAAAAYVPISPDMPARRIGHIVEDAGIQVILCEEQRAVDGFSGTALCVRDGNIEDLQGEPPGVVADTQNAYAIYTSGTTGKPKGVTITHAALGNLCSWNRDLTHMSRSDKVAAYCSFMFDVSVAEIFPPLVCGAELHILPEDSRGSVREINQYFEAHDISVATLPTRVGELFQNHVEKTSLRVLTVAGERLCTYRERGYELINAYGPTEATVYATAYRVRKNEDSIPIGTPAYNTWAYVVDRDLKPVEVGREGELLLAGVLLSSGYINQPRLTARSFVSNPLATEVKNAVAFKTGDRVLLSQDGHLIFLGRMDRQFKLRGFRVEPAEIEHSLRSHPGVLGCHVMMVDKEGDESLCAFVVEKDGTEPHGFKAYLEQRLPGHMIPTRFVRIQEIPLGKSGKTDEASLEKLVHQAALDAGDSIAIEGSAAELHEIWKRILRRDDVSVFDNFFNVGGDSLKAMSLFVEIESVFGRVYPVSLLYRYPTVESLAGAIEAPNGEGAELIVTMGKGVGTRNVFCVHDFTGDVLPYTNISAMLNRAGYIYGVRYSALVDDSIGTIEYLAARYIDALKKVQPSGPYHLLGYSIGGIIAYEMARQLWEQGEQVGLLGIIDTPNLRRDRHFVDSFLYSSLRNVLIWIRSMSLLYKAMFVYSNARQLLTSGGLRRLIDSLRQMRRMMLRYDPKPWPGRMMLFKARERVVKVDDTLGWGDLVASVVGHEVPGNHISVLNKKNAAQIAEHLNKAI